MIGAPHRTQTMLLLAPSQQQSSRAGISGASLVAQQQQRSVNGICEAESCWRWQILRVTSEFNLHERIKVSSHFLTDIFGGKRLSCVRTCVIIKASVSLPSPSKVRREATEPCWLLLSSIHKFTKAKPLPSSRPSLVSVLPSNG